MMLHIYRNKKRSSVYFFADIILAAAMYLPFAASAQDTQTNPTTSSSLSVPCGNGADDTEAIQNIFDQAASSPDFAHKGVEIVFPSGECVSSKALSLSTSDDRSISIKGAGKETTRLIFQTGGINISLAAGGALYAHDFNLRRQSSGQGDVGMSVSAPAGQVRSQIDHILVDGAPRSGSWLHGVEFLNIGPVISDMQIQLPDVSDKGAFMSIGLLIRGTVNLQDSSQNIYAIDTKIVNSTFQGGYHGVEVSGAVQGMFISNSESIGNNVGFYWDGSEPNSYAELLLLSNFHANSHLCGVCTNKVNQMSIYGGLFLHFVPNDDAYQSVNITDGQNLTIFGTVTNGSGTGSEVAIATNNFNEINIFGNQALTLKGPMISVYNGSYINVTGNTGGNFIGYAGNAILGCDSAHNVTCSVNNAF